MKTNDFARHAATLAVTSKCLEAMASLSAPERKKVVMGLFYACLDDSVPEEKAVLDQLLAHAGVT